ncbi:MAG: hypothetical protein ACYTF0_04120, partial [Planctomycetota bacterium]
MHRHLPTLAILLTIATGPASEEPPAWVADVRTAVRADLARDALPLHQALPAIHVTASYQPDLGLLSGHARFALNNPWPTTLETIGFALHANNSSAYQGSSIRIDHAMVNGHAVEADLVADGRGLLLPLATPLASGAWVECELSFTTTLPEGGGRAGLLAKQARCHTLYSWLPEPAIWTDG